MIPQIPPRLRKFYAIDKGRIFRGSSRIEGADLDSFEPLNESFSRDGSQVFYLNKPVQKADRNTFVALNRIYAKDKDHVFDGSSVVEGADPGAFTFWEGVPDRPGEIRHYGRDKNAIYHKVLTIGQVVVVRRADPATFRPVSFGFGVDDKQVFYERWRLPKADPRTWSLIGRGYSRDEHRVFYFEREIGGAEPATFELLPANDQWARDRCRYYNLDQPKDCDSYLKSLRQLYIFAGTVRHAAIVDREGKHVSDATEGNPHRHLSVLLEIECRERLWKPADQKCPARTAGEVTQVRLAVEEASPSEWTGREWIWFLQCSQFGKAPPQLQPILPWSVFEPASGRSRIDSLLRQL